MDPSEIIRYVIYIAFYLAILGVYFIALRKLKFFSKKTSGRKSSSGKKLLTTGVVLFVLSKVLTYIFLVLQIYIQALFSISDIMYYLSIVIVVIGLIMYIKSSNGNVDDSDKSDCNEQFVNEPVANEVISAQAQFTYNKFLNEFNQDSLVADELTQAKIFAKAVQLQLLKTPASAIFCHLDEMNVVQIGEFTYSVSGYVDSQNSYGAMLRNQFSLTVFKSSDGTWKNADKFVSTEATIRKTFFSNAILWWILGIVGTIIVMAVSFGFTSSMF